MGVIAVSYTPSGGSPVYNFVFKEFIGGDLPRTYSATASFSYAANGSSLITGPASRQKRVWAVSSKLTLSEASDFMAMFEAWDQDRGSGLPAALGLVDTTFGATVTTSVVVSTPPTFSKMGPQYMVLNVGLMEV